MRTEDMKAILVWLVRYLQKHKPKELSDLENREVSWGDLKRISPIEDWIDTRAKKKWEACMKIQEGLREMKLISIREYSNTGELTKAVLRELAGIMKIEEHNHKISRKDLEKLVVKFAKASA